MMTMSFRRHSGYFPAYLEVLHSSGYFFGSLRIPAIGMQVPRIVSPTAILDRMVRIYSGDSGNGAKAIEDSHQNIRCAETVGFAQLLGKHPFSHAAIREFEYQMKLEFSVVIKAPRQAPMIKMHTAPAAEYHGCSGRRGFPATSETGITPLATEYPSAYIGRQTQSVTPVMTFTMIFWGHFQSSVQSP